MTALPGGFRFRGESVWAGHMRWFFERGSSRIMLLWGGLGLWLFRGQGSETGWFCIDRARRAGSSHKFA